MVINQYDIVLVNLEPTIGHEIKKSRPCVIISPIEMNSRIATIMIAPMTTKSHAYPSRVELSFSGKHGWIVLDQIRSIDKRRVLKHLGKIEIKTIERLKFIIKEMLVD